MWCVSHAPRYPVRLWQLLARDKRTALPRCATRVREREHVGAPRLRHLSPTVMQRPASEVNSLSVPAQMFVRSSHFIFCSFTCVCVCVCSCLKLYDYNYCVRNNLRGTHSSPPFRSPDVIISLCVTRLRVGWIYILIQQKHLKTPLNLEFYRTVFHEVRFKWTDMLPKRAQQS